MSYHTPPGPGQPGIGLKFFGKYKGIVRDNADFEGKGRLQVEVPDVHGTKRLWAQPCVPYADQGHGFFFMPPAGTQVWVEFEGGDRSRPIWAGFAWGSGGAPAMTPAEMVLSTPAGKLSFDTNNAQGNLRLEAGTMSVTLSDGAVTVEISGGGTIEVKSSGDVTVSSGGSGKVEVTKAGTKVNGGSLEVM